MKERRNPSVQKTSAKANTAQILGNSSAPAPVPSKWQQQYNRLLALRDETHRRRGAMSDMAREEQPTFSLHMADAGTDEFDRDFALSMISSDQNALYEIDAALNRIRTDSYGVCELTGKPIERERLAAIPWTRFSADAQRELEANGSVTRSKLGARGSLDSTAPSQRELDEDTARENESS